MRKYVKWLTLHTPYLRVCIHSSTSDSRNIALFRISQFVTENGNVLFSKSWHFGICFLDDANSWYYYKRATIYLIDLRFFIASFAMLDKVCFIVCLKCSFILFMDVVLTCAPCISNMGITWVLVRKAESHYSFLPQLDQNLCFNKISWWFIYTLNLRILVCTHYFYFITSHLLSQFIVFNLPVLRKTLMTY